VELYNSGDEEVDIDGWSIVPLNDPTKEEDIFDHIISPKGFFVISFEGRWLDPSSQETLILRDSEDMLVDSTRLLSVDLYSDCTWGRYPDGSPKWIFQEPTRGSPSSGVLCDVAEYESLHFGFKMDGKVIGSGFLNINNLMVGSDNAMVKSNEHGSGRYECEESRNYSSDLILGTNTTIGTNTMIQNKNNLAARYDDTALNVTANRSVGFDSRWAESSRAWSDRYSQYASESYRYATSIDSDHSVGFDSRWTTEVDSDQRILSNYSHLTAKTDSEFEGIGRIESSLTNFKSSEEYVGSFKVLNNILDNDLWTIESSVTGEGFVDANKKIGNVVETYERGTGAYQVNEMIDLREKSLYKDINLVHEPVNYTYVGDDALSRSIMWSEGTRSGKSGVSFLGTEYSNIKKLEAETEVISSAKARTSANFSGNARMQAVFQDQSESASGMVHIDDEYVGNYSISRQISIMPIYDKPHISVANEGRIRKPGCDIFEYTITMVNDGNKALGPVYLKDTFPSGTQFLEASLQPFELASRYANWSIPIFSPGSFVTIYLDLQITNRSENNTNRLNAYTIYQYTTGTRTLDRKLRASNTSVLKVDWSDCSSQNISATFSANSNPKNPKILTYVLIVQNLAEENISTNITTILPQNVKFINSMNRSSQNRSSEIRSSSSEIRSLEIRPSAINENRISWTIDKLMPDERKAIIFRAEAEQDGLITSSANIRGSSLDGREIAAINVSASIILGRLASTICSSDWLPCDGDLLGPDSWNKTMISSGSELGCICTSYYPNQVVSERTDLMLDQPRALR